MGIEAISLKNFRVFQNLEISRIGGMAIFIGANGSGKTTLFDAFGFLRDALKDNVHWALQKRGGYREVVSRGHEGEAVEIEVKFRLAVAEKSRRATYHLKVAERDGKGIVAREFLAFKRGESGAPFHFLDFKRGKGKAVTNEEDFDKPEKLLKEDQILDSPSILAIKGLGQFQRFKAASEFRRLIENWHVSDFRIDAARNPPPAGLAEHLSVTGDNLALVARNMFEQHKIIFEKILKTMKARVPGVKHVEATLTEDSRILLRFRDEAFKDPFAARFVSDGTIKMFAYLLLLNDPEPHPLLCIEEPENQLYISLLGNLAEEIRSYAARGEGQVFVTTHSPEFLNAAAPEEVFWLEKRKGYACIRRASEDKQLLAFLSEGESLGRLWKQGFLEGANP